MGKKKIGFLLPLLILSNIHTYAQELQWQEKNELTKSLYKAFEDFINEEPEPYKKQKTGRYNSLWEFLTSNKRRKNTELQKKREAKIFIESHFIFHDTVSELVFFDKNQMIEWGKSLGAYVFVQLEEFNVNCCNIFILMVDGCSGLRCLGIYVFEQESENWKLITGTYTDIRENIIIKTDNEQNKIIFETISRKIGELQITP